MPSKDKGHSSITSSDQELVLSSLEPRTTRRAEKAPDSQAHLRGLEKFVIWSLRIYLLFMMVVVIYQVWASLR